MKIHENIQRWHAISILNPAGRRAERYFQVLGTSHYTPHTIEQKNIFKKILKFVGTSFYRV
jgi:hypothetical protein